MYLVINSFAKSLQDCKILKVSIDYYVFTFVYNIGDFRIGKEMYLSLAGSFLIFQAIFINSNTQFVELLKDKNVVYKIK